MKRLLEFGEGHLHQNSPFFKQPIRLFMRQTAAPGKACNTDGNGQAGRPGNDGLRQAGAVAIVAKLEILIANRKHVTILQCYSVILSLSGMLTSSKIKPPGKDQA